MATLPSLIQTESGGNWAAQNNEVGAGGARGHFGRVQFGRARFSEAQAAGAVPAGMTIEQFGSDTPEGRAAQMSAEAWHFGDLENSLGDLVGTVVNGVPMTMDALLAMGHLGGKGGARRYVTSGGKYNPSDSFGTSLSDYAAKHGGRGGQRAQPVNSGGADAGQANNPPPVDMNPARLAWAYRTGRMTPEDKALYERGIAAGKFQAPARPAQQPDPLAVYAQTAQRQRAPVQTIDIGAGMKQSQWPGFAG